MDLRERLEYWLYVFTLSRRAPMILVFAFLAPVLVLLIGILFSSVVSVEGYFAPITSVVHAMTIERCTTMAIFVFVACLIALRRELITTKRRLEQI